jgi:hypothetical protein
MIKKNDPLSNKCQDVQLPCEKLRHKVFELCEEIEKYLREYGWKPNTHDWIVTLDKRRWELPYHEGTISADNIFTALRLQSEMNIDKEYLKDSNTNFHKLVDIINKLKKQLKKEKIKNAKTK